MRKRIRLNAICSSDNYEESRKLHIEYVQKYCKEHIEEFTKLTQEIKSETKCYVSCFGKLIEITELEATKIEKSIKIIRK